MNGEFDVRGLSKALGELLIKVKESDTLGMQSLGNELIKTAVVVQSKAIVRLAMICYALSKIYHKDQYRKNQMKWSEFEIDLKNDVRNAQEAAGRGDTQTLSEKTDKIFSDIRNLDASFGYFVSKITDKAMIRKGSTLYAMGLSLGMASELTGATEWELLHASGKTKMSDEEKITKPLRERLENARRALA